MNAIMRDHMLSLFSQHVREDGRGFEDIRDVRVAYGVSAKSAEGSARVCIGDTEVVAGVKLELGKPFPDKLDEGTLMVNVELLPMSNPAFEGGPPGIDAIELSRVVDRGLREGKEIDFKKLCVTPGESVWIILIDIYPINDAGNLFDAAALAAIAALCDTRFPALVDGVVDYKQRTKQSLPLGTLPLSCTVIKIGDTILVDPTLNESNMVDARLTASILSDGSLCALQKGGDEALSFDEVQHMVDVASHVVQTYRKVL